MRKIGESAGRGRVSAMIPGGLWPIYLFLIACHGPLIVLTWNLNRISIETVAYSVLALYLGLVALRSLLVLLFGRPEVTDLPLAVFSIFALHTNFLTNEVFSVMFLAWTVGLVALGAISILRPAIRKLVGSALCIFLAAVNGMAVLTIARSDGWTEREKLRAVLANHYSPLPTLPKNDRADAPDIYYLVFDRYARADQLAQRYQFDNSAFLGKLRERGFQIASRSYAAYQRTAHSVASTLNLDYLPVLDEKASSDWLPLYELLRRPRLYPVLRDAGYRIVNAGSWWEPTRVSPAADENITYLAPAVGLRPTIEQSMILRGLTNLGLRTLDARHRQCQRVRYKFDALKRLGAGQRPVFVFGHFLIPHPPFVIDANGACTSAAAAKGRSRRDNYIAQVEYTNRSILKLVEEILKRRPNSVIVLQSDEGPWPKQYAGEEVMHFGADVSSVDWTKVPPADLREKMAILNAIYLPPGKRVAIADDHAPVNTFRMVLREFFGMPIKDLPTRSMIYLNDREIWRFHNVGSVLGETGSK